MGASHCRCAKNTKIGRKPRPPQISISFGVTRWGPQPFLSDLGRGDARWWWKMLCPWSPPCGWSMDPWCVHIFLKKRTYKMIGQWTSWGFSWIFYLRWVFFRKWGAPRAPRNHLFESALPWNKPSSYWGTPMTMETPNDVLRLIFFRVVWVETFFCYLSVIKHPNGYVP